MVAALMLAIAPGRLIGRADIAPLDIVAGNTESIGLFGFWYTGFGLRWILTILTATDHAIGLITYGWQRQLKIVETGPYLL